MLGGVGSGWLYIMKRLSRRGCRMFFTVCHWRPPFWQPGRGRAMRVRFWVLARFRSCWVDWWISWVLDGFRQWCLVGKDMIMVVLSVRMMWTLLPCWVIRFPSVFANWGQRWAAVWAIPRPHTASPLVLVVPLVVMHRALALPISVKMLPVCSIMGRCR